MMQIKFNKNPLKILCLGAHCDDIEIGAGCTMLKLFKEYKIEQVIWIVFASDDIRKQEAIKSAEKFMSGITQKKLVVHSYCDGFLPYHAIEIKKEFEKIKNEISPDIIFTHYHKDSHQDHRLISDLTWNTWRNHLILEYEIPKYDGDLGKPNFYVSSDVDYVSKRNRILHETFITQHSKQWFNDETFLAISHLRGIESANKFAEAFYARKITH